MNPIFLAPLRAVGAYFFLLLLARFMGRKMISQMTFFDFVVGVTVGTVTANIALGPNSTPLSAAAVLGMLALLTVAIDFTHIKSFIFTKIVDSEPLVVIKKGDLIFENIRRARMPMTELLALLRQKKVFTISDVDYAVLETDGKLSVLKKPERQPVTPSDLNIKSTYRGLGSDLVIDGVILEENLRVAGLNKTSLVKKLETQGVKDIEKILYARIDATGQLYISLKETYQEQHGAHGID